MNTDTFSYTVNADQSHTVTNETPNAVVGFYADEHYTIGEGNRPWQIILGIRDGDDFLSERLRIGMPFPTEG